MLFLILGKFLLNISSNMAPAYSFSLVLVSFRLHIRPFHHVPCSFWRFNIFKGFFLFASTLMLSSVHSFSLLLWVVWCFNHLLNSWIECIFYFYWVECPNCLWGLFGLQCSSSLAFFCLSSVSLLYPLFVYFILQFCPFLIHTFWGSAVRCIYIFIIGISSYRIHLFIILKYHLYL